MYHSIVEKIVNNNLEICVATIKNHVKWLQMLGYNFVTISDLLNTKNNNNVAITFDDGYEDILNITPFLFKRQIPASLFICPGDLGKTNYWASTNFGIKRILKTENLIELNNNNIEILPHGWIHYDMTMVNDTILSRDIILTSKWFKEKLGVIPNIIAYPFGSINNRKISLLRKYFKYGIAVDLDNNIKISDFYIPRIPVVETMTINWLIKQAKIKNVPANLLTN